MIYSGINDAKIQQKPIGKILNKKSNGTISITNSQKNIVYLFSCGAIS